MKVVAGCFAAFLVVVSTAWAQEPLQSLSELPQRVQKGDRVKVTAKDGTVISGRFDSVSNSSVRLNGSGSGLREIPGTTIKEIQRKRPESAWNGVLIGLAAGVAGGVVATNATCGPNDSECSAIAGLAFIPSFAAGGAAVGAIIDRLISKYDPIYVQQAAADRMHLRLSPIVSKHTKGIQVSMSF
jgi:hypothetical protein